MKIFKLLALLVMVFGLWEISQQPISAAGQSKTAGPCEHICDVNESNCYGDSEYQRRMCEEPAEYALTQCESDADADHQYCLDNFGTHASAIAACDAAYYFQLSGCQGPYWSSVGDCGAAADQRQEACSITHGECIDACPPN